MEPALSTISRLACATAFSPLCRNSTPGGAAILDEDFCRDGMCDHLDIVAPHCRTEEGVGRRDPPAVRDVELVDADALLFGAVEVGIPRQAEFGAGIQKALGERVCHPAHVGDVHGSGRSRATGRLRPRCPQAP
jgi:hypothetical protein